MCVRILLASPAIYVSAYCYSYICVRILLALYVSAYTYIYVTACYCYIQQAAGWPVEEDGEEEEEEKGVGEEQEGQEGGGCKVSV
jgi:hypothetical protein